MSRISRLRNAVNSRRLDGDLADELRDHIERRAADLIAAGVDPSEARRKASAIFGNEPLLREQAREFRLSSALEFFLQDVRYASRGLRRSPTFAFTAVASLALAIGANTAIYSVVDAALLRSLAVPQPQRLIVASAPTPRKVGAQAGESRLFSYPNYLRMRGAASGQAALAFFSQPGRAEVMADNANGVIEIATQQFVSGRAFEMLNVRPAAGTLFSAADDRAEGTPATVVISHEYWRRRFSLEPGAMGRVIYVDGRAFRIIGVTGEEFTGIEPGKFVDIWLPVTMFDPGALTNDAFTWGYVLGRLAPTADRGRLQARLQLFQSGIVVEWGNAGVSAFRDSFAKPLWIVLGAAAIMLLIACSNVASLLLARSLAREPEMGLRVSLGASRSRLALQTMTESFLLATLAVLAGWSISHWTAPVLTGLIATNTGPLQLQLVSGVHEFLLCAAVCGVCALLFGTIPAWQAAAARPILALRQSGGQTNRAGIGRWFVGAQVAFAFCLMVSGAGFLLSLHNLFTADTGFNLKGVLVASLVIERGGPGLPEIRALQHRVESAPGIQAAAYAWMPIFDGNPRAQRIGLPGAPLSSSQEPFYRISPGYFRTLKIPILEGRELLPEEDDAVPVPSIVNRAFAREYFGGEPALGREFVRDDGVLHRIVGLAANASYGDLRNGPRPTVYFPMKPPRRFVLYVRSPLDPAFAALVIQREVSVMGPGAHVVEATTLEALVGKSIFRERLLAGIGGVFASLGLVLASIGIFGLLNYAVTRRTREIGIRSALGAGRAKLVVLLLKDIWGTLAGGLLLGLAGGITLLRIGGSFLFGIGPADPGTVAIAGFAFVAATMIAGGIPARRAISIDPLDALRQD